MRVSGRIGWLLVALLTLVLMACGGAAPPAGPAGSSGPSTSPLASLGPDEIGVCEAMLVMEAGLARVQTVKLRAGARHRLDQAVQSVLTGQDALLQRAPYWMRTRLRTLGIAVTNLVLAVEDFRTTIHLDVAAVNVKRASTQLRKSINSFQRWVGCGALVVPTDPPDASPSRAWSPTTPHSRQSTADRSSARLVRSQRRASSVRGAWVRASAQNDAPWLA